MKGIQYVTDEKGNRTAMLIDKRSPLWEDLQDSMLLEERLKEPRESLASVRKRHEKRKAAISRV